MNQKLIADKSIREWKAEYPLLKQIIDTEEVWWANPKYKEFVEAKFKLSLDFKDVEEAEARLRRFGPYLSRVFPKTRQSNGIIESPLVNISKFKEKLEMISGLDLPGELLLKSDNQLPIAGSIKARGGIYEVLKHAEELAVEHELLNLKDDYSILATDKFKEFLAQYSIVVGSTGNLGLSIGIMGAKLGFKVTVHMSIDAKEWKKELLREHGVEVVEHTSDYNQAVEEGRKQAEADSQSYFIDDEQSVDLFLGYSVAALRLKEQLLAMDLEVSSKRPLFVYLPCGVGGAPGGIAFGLKLVFQDNVHCFFVEPTRSPCMLLGLLTGQHNQISVQDFGLDKKTVADGLAVGRASAFVGQMIEELVSGIYTIEDQKLYILLSYLFEVEEISLEPSAAAGLVGPVRLLNEKVGLRYLNDNNLLAKMENAIHIPWATGGSMVPSHIMEKYHQQGCQLRREI
ncbi:D-serine ammonia-lyase [Natroniella sp. ANB-PHB2]|uniref:D-serine ammonia-lyase n=1 Tax=Natroniella sp. ANB-PHB2 TaxID=3384444 RepID=UPI0038D4F3DF